MPVHMPMGRRTFVRNTALGVGAAMLAHRVAWPASFDARIEVALNEELGTISPNIYGHFAENLGAVIYDSV